MFSSNILENIPKESYALVTGATDGIGFELALQLSKLNYKLILVSRNLEKLKASQEKVPNSLIISCDLSKGVSQELRDLINDKKPTILINNAGISYPHAEYLENLPMDFYDNLLDLNCKAIVDLCRCCLPHMKETSQGVIINMGSGNGRLACGGPLYAAYSGSKAFVEAFSRGLHYEVKEFGITVQCVIPYYVSTKMSRMRPSMSVPSAKSFAESILKGNTSPVTIPHWLHYLMDLILSVFSLSNWILPMNKKIRKKALEKNNVKKN